MVVMPASDDQLLAGQYVYCSCTRRGWRILDCAIERVKGAPVYRYLSDMAEVATNTVSILTETEIL